ncbi:MAG: DUF2723 domain-containing protein [Elusimicrobia bacterium]|nr:DUF2723 domain-containing protein [Elusimicrobiota bacterium]
MSAAVFAFFALLGAPAAAPAVSVGDSGEFIAAAATLSVLHPPGYPLYVLAGHAFGSLLPWGTWAWRMNLLSGLCAAGALSLLFAALRRWGFAAAPCALGVLVLGASPLWLHANGQAEIFGLHLLLGAACVWVLARAGPRAFGARSMAALGLLLGLATGAHHTLALAVPALLASAWLAARPSGRQALRGLGVLSAFACIGFSVQAVLPLRAQAVPPLDWGHPADLARFLRVFLRRDYGSLSLTVEGAAGSRLAGVWAQTARWFSEAGAGLGAAGAGLALLGGLGLARDREKRPFLVLATGMLLLAGPAFLWLGNPPFDAQTSYALKRFWLLPWMAAALLAGAGADRLWAWGAAGRAAVGLLALAAALGARSSLPDWGQRWDLAAHDYGRDLLRSLPPGAALFIDGGDDTFYTLAAALYADGLRPDLAVADRGGLVFHSPYGPDFRGLAKEAKEARRREVELAGAASRPTYYATLERAVNPRGTLLLEGLLRRLEPGRGSAQLARESPLGPALWAAYAARHDSAAERAHYRMRALTPFYPVMRSAALSARGDRPGALRQLRAAVAAGGDTRWVRSTTASEAEWSAWSAAAAGDWAGAEAAYRQALRADPARAEAWTNLGAVLDRMGRAAEARAAHERAAALAPGSYQSRFNLGSLLYRASDFAGAAREFSAAAALRPGDADASLWAGRAAHKAREARP